MLALRTSGTNTYKAKIPAGGRDWRGGGGGVQAEIQIFKLLSEGMGA